MKLKTTILVAVSALSANAATSITLQNTAGSAGGYPIVDNAGVPIPTASSKVQVGTFTPAFASTLGELDTLVSDAAVIAAFTPTGSNGPFARNGLFNYNIGDADSSGSLGTSSAPFYVLVSYTPAGGTPQALVFKPGATTFPLQDGTGAAAVDLGRWLAVTDVAFGNKTLVPVNLDASGYPNALKKAEFSQGITFDTVVPEPSTGLLAGLAGLALLARRRR